MPNTEETPEVTEVAEELSFGRQMKKVMLPEYFELYSGDYFSKKGHEDKSIQLGYCLDLMVQLVKKHDSLADEVGKVKNRIKPVHGKTKAKEARPTTIADVLALEGF
jgi:hypothetical protein